MEQRVDFIEDGEKAGDEPDKILTSLSEEGNRLPKGRKNSKKHCHMGSQEDA